MLGEPLKRPLAHPLCTQTPSNTEREEGTMEGGREGGRMERGRDNGGRERGREGGREI